MSKLLMDEKPLLVMPSLATKVGLSESIFLQQLHYWLDRSVNVKEGHKWVYNSAKEWQAQFPFWSINTIRRVIKSLEDKQLVISGNFNSLPIDKTKWYRIDYEIIKEIENEDCDSRKVESTTQNEYSKHPKQVIEAPKLGRPLPESTTESTSEINNNNINAGVEEEKGIAETPFSFYEKNGFGILTPHVGEKIGSWIDDTNEELVIHAMKISVENGVPRWNYAETILRDWHNKKITSIDQVLASEKKREQEKVTASAGKRNYRPGREENPPEWLGKDKQKKKDVPTPAKSKEEVDAERAALIKELQGDS